MGAGRKTKDFLIWLFEWEVFDDPKETTDPRVESAPIVDIAVADTVVQAPTERTPRPAPVQPVIEELTNAHDYLLELVFHATTAKDPRIQESNEDAWAWDEAGNRAAVLDGATESFAAQRWAGLLAEKWMAGGYDWVANAQLAYADAMDGVELTWAQEAAAERGSFATLASVKAVSGGVELQIVGDSCVFLIRGNRILRSAPFTEEAQFSSAPQALASAQGLAEANGRAMSHATWQFAVETGTVDEVLLATDAISAWLLGDDRHRRMERLLAVSDADGFRELVHAEREAGRLKADDSTIVRLNLGTRA